jgi:hypothetical protein
MAGERIGQTLNPRELRTIQGEPPRVREYGVEPSKREGRADGGLGAGVKLASTLALTQVWRIGGGLFLFEMLRGNLPAAFAVPAGVGDILMGVTAPLLALTLRKGGALTWATAIVWNALGITDLVYAVTLGLLAGAGYVLASYLVVIPTVLVPAAITIHLLTIGTLMRKGVRRGFVARV